MVPSVDDLLAADVSSDEDVTPAAKGKGSDATGDQAQQTSRPELTIEQAMAQVDLSDDDEDLSPQACSVPAAAQSELVPQSSGTAGATCDSPRDDAGATSQAAPMALDDLLAMDSDDSSEDGGAPSRSKDQAVTEKKREDPPLQEKAKQDVPAPADSESTEAFARAPLEWCLEHERSLLLASAYENSLAAEQGESKSGAASNEIKAPPSMVEVRTCPELKRILAQEVGLPTCVIAHSRMVGVGTLRGAVVLFDPKNQDVSGEPVVLHPASSDDAVAVTSAAFSPDMSSLLVGHKTGHLVLWDLATNKVAHAVKDLHSCPVLSVAFCRRSWQHVLSADAKGSVYLITFSNSFGRRDCSRQLLMEPSANIGVTLRILPLPQVPQQVVHPADSHCLVALVATNATVLLTLHPTVQLLQKMQYHTKDVSAQSSWIPDAAWLRVETREWVEALQVQASDPHLCVAYGQSIHIMRVSFERGARTEEFKIRLSQRYTWPLPIQSVVSFNESVMAILDSSNKLTVVQLPPPVEEQGKSSSAAASAAAPATDLVTIHAEPVGAWSVAYHTHASPEGGGEARCHHGALAVVKGRSRSLYVCGMKEVWNIQVSRWGQHIEELVNKNKWSAALDVFLSVHRGALPPLLDFPHTTTTRQRAVGLRTTQVVQSYLASRLQQDTGRVQVREMCKTAINACIEMKLWSVLYKTVFECFKAAGHMNVYCNTLEPFIVQGRIPRGQMDSEVLSSILQSYALPLEEEEHMALQQCKNAGPDGATQVPDFVDCDHCAALFPVARRLQQLVFYVDVLQIDLNFALRLFTQHRLWTALVHVYCALKDYISPLELLVGECSQLAKKCRAKIADGADAREAPLVHCRLVRKLFFFLQRCFALRPFPLDFKEGNGMVAPSYSVISELVGCIFKPDTRAGAPPMFLRLIRLSPMSFFGALSVLYTEPLASHAMQNQSQGAKAASSPLGEAYSPLTLSSLFQAIEDAVEAARTQASEEGMPLPPHTESEFLWFVARAAPKARMALRSERREQVVEHLLAMQPNASSSSSSSFSRHSAEEAEQLLIGVFSALDSIDEDKRDDWVRKAMHRGFFELASWLHEEYGEYDRALDCRMRDHNLRDAIFEFIITRLAEKCDNKEHTAYIVDAALQRLPRLVAIDSERCAAMVCEQFTSMASHESVLPHLQNFPEIELQYLETLLVRRMQKGCEEQVAFFNAHVVRYVGLLCSLSPKSVLPFLEENEALPLRECLELCRKHSVIDGSVYLLERTGDFAAVQELLLSDYTKALDQLHSSFTDVSDSNRATVSRAVKRLCGTGKDSQQSAAVSKAFGEGFWWEGFADAQRCISIIDNTYEMCARNSNLMSTSQLEDLWFGVLGSTIRWQERSGPSESQSKRTAGFCAALGELNGRAMAGVLAFLSLPRALQRICSQFGSSALGVWQGPLQSLLSGLNFQQGVLKAAMAVSSKDVVKPFMAVKTRGSLGVRVSPQSLIRQPDGTFLVPFGDATSAAVNSTSPPSTRSGNT